MNSGGYARMAILCQAKNRPAAGGLHLGFVMSLIHSWLIYEVLGADTSASLSPIKLRTFVAEFKPQGHIGPTRGGSLRGFWLHETRMETFSSDGLRVDYLK